MVWDILFKVILTTILARSIYLYVKPITPRAVNEEALRAFNSYSWPKKTLTVIFGVPLILIWEVLPNYISKTPEVLGTWLVRLYEWTKAIVIWYIEGVKYLFREFVAAVWSFMVYIYDGVVELSTWLWDNVLYPGLKLFGRGFRWLAVKIWEYILVPIGDAVIRVGKWLNNKLDAIYEALCDYLARFGKWLTIKIIELCVHLVALKDFVVNYLISVWEELYLWYTVAYEIGHAIVYWFLEKLWSAYEFLRYAAAYLWSCVPDFSGMIRAKLRAVYESLCDMITVGWTIITTGLAAMYASCVNMIVAAWAGTVAMSTSAWVGVSNMANAGWAAASDSVKTAMS